MNEGVRRACSKNGGFLDAQTHAGLAAARARGRAGGCKPKLDEKDVKEIRALWCETPTLLTLQGATGVSRTTLYKHLDGPASMQAR